MVFSYKYAMPSLQYNDICWKGAPSDVNQLHKVFPAVEWVFEGNTRLPMKPLQYLFVMNTKSGSYCLGVFDNGAQGTLIGGITVRNVLVQVGPLDKHRALWHVVPQSACVCYCSASLCVDNIEVIRVHADHMMHHARTIQ